MKKLLASLAIIFLFSTVLFAQIPKPEDTYGFKVGADYKLAKYDQMLTYYDKLVASSDRIQMIEIGKSVMGKSIKMFIISSPENLKSIAKWKETSTKLARAKISPEEATELS
jgi:hypothetical protein